jgi:hypothetical protein
VEAIEIQQLPGRLENRGLGAEREKALKALDQIRRKVGKGALPDYRVNTWSGACLTNL